jgi:hypothetical protein
LKAASQRLGDNNVRIRIARYAADYLLDYFYRKENLRKLQDEFAAVQDGTALPLSRCCGECMVRKKTKKNIGNALRASVMKEMAKPRMTRSARIAELNLDAARIPEQPSVTMSGNVDKIIPSLRPSQPEKAQIAVDGADHRY